jgi:hypothetical protein
MAHIERMFQSCPDFDRHVPLYGYHSGDDAHSHIWQGCYVDSVLGLSCLWINSGVCIEQPLRSFCKVQAAGYLVLWIRDFRDQLSPAQIIEKFSCINDKQTLRVFLISDAYHAIGDSLLTLL